MKKTLSLTMFLFLTAMSCCAQDNTFIEKIKELFGAPTRQVDNNGLPAFQPPTNAPHRGHSGNSRQGRAASPSGGTVKLSAEQYSALYNLALQGQAQAQAPAQPVAAAYAPYQPYQPAAPPTNPSSEQDDSSATPSIPDTRVVLPAAAAITRPIRESARSMGAPPLRRKQRGARGEEADQ